VWRRRGDHPLARSAACSAIATEPYREDAHRLLIQVELDSGNRASARDAARRCLETFVEELGFEPSEQTLELVRRAGA
jgi:DNA-binding SARP family transcriptional activator